MSEPNDGVEQALAILEIANSHVAEPHAMVVLPSDSDRFIIGNKGGLIRLAIATLRAAQGEKQSFVNSDWVYEDDIDWGVKGIELDETAHVSIPEKKSKVRLVIEKLVAYTVLIAIVSIFVVGIVTLSHWLWHPKFR
jgi:hypothetical protein